MLENVIFGKSKKKLYPNKRRNSVYVCMCVCVRHMGSDREEEFYLLLLLFLFLILSWFPLLMVKSCVKIGSGFL